MITPNSIRYDLSHAPTNVVTYNHGFSAHPGDKNITVRALSLFAESKTLLEEAVKSYQGYGWSAWIVGTMEGIPAAYLYKELT